MAQRRQWFVCRVNSAILRCIVPACPIYEAAKNTGIWFSRLPQGPEMLRKCLAVVKNEGYAVSTKYEAVKQLCVCGRYFVDIDVSDEFRLTKELSIMFRCLDKSSDNWTLVGTIIGVVVALIVVVIAGVVIYIKCCCKKSGHRNSRNYDNQRKLPGFNRGAQSGDEESRNAQSEGDEESTVSHIYERVEDGTAH